MSPGDQIIPSLSIWRFCPRGVKSLGGEAARGMGRKRPCPGFAARCGGSAAKTFDPTRTKPPATQANPGGLGGLGGLGRGIPYENNGVDRRTFYLLRGRGFIAFLPLGY